MVTETISVASSKKEELIDITGKVRACLKKSGLKDGLCTVFVPHTTAGITINEHADPDVKEDIIKGLRFVPERGFKHNEGNSPSHIKSSVIGCSQTIIVENGSMRLGTWQGIYFAEFDGPRNREIYVKVVSG